jgi:hypothetical protein
VVGGIRKRERDSRLQRLRGLRERRPDLLSGRGGLAAQQQDLDLAPSRLREEPRRQNARVVRDQEIARRKERRQLMERVVADGARRAVEGEEPGVVPRGGGMLRDPVPGKRVVEIRCRDGALGLRRNRAS